VAVGVLALLAGDVADVNIPEPCILANFTGFADGFDGRGRAVGEAICGMEAAYVPRNVGSDRNEEVG
jgi:hypothetical protein